MSARTASVARQGRERDPQTAQPERCLPPAHWPPITRVKTLGILLWKDLRRAWRNPVGWLVFLAVPLVITGLIGAIFGPKSNTSALGRIRFAVVDEDDSVLTKFLRGGLSQDKGG